MKRITDEEVNALLEAVDFISNNSDGADDQEYYQDLAANVQSAWKKLKAEHQRQSNERIKAMAKRMVAKELKRRALARKEPEA